MTVLQVCAYGAEYSGNFIASLTTLEKCLMDKGIQTVYAFVDRAKNKIWCQEIAARTKVYFLPEAKARILPKTYVIFKQIYHENQIDIVHCHFELYDIPATVTAPKNTRVFWHLHDPIDIGSGLRSIIWRIQYGVVSKRANLISVSEHYRKSVVKLGFPETQTTTVLNSIDLNRVQDCRTNDKKEYDFLTFGWDFFRKGDDLILKACQKLEEDGFQFKLLLNGNDNTWPKLDEFFGQKDPEWLVRGQPVSDINQLFKQSGMFIQASRRETFSYAVCEATYAGLPVITSDISGLEWAHELKSVSFFPNENWEQLFLMMKGYLQGNNCGVEDVNSSRELVLKKYSLEVWAANIMKQYQV